MSHTRIVTSYDLGPAGAILIASLGDDPAAGQEATITVPGRAVWEVVALTVQLTTSATSGTRQVNLFLDDGSNIFCVVPRPGTQSNNATERYVYYHAGEDSSGTATANRGSLPSPLTMLPGWRIRTVTSSLKSDDNFTAPVVYVREVPQRGVEVGQEALRSALRRLIGEEAFSG